MKKISILIMIMMLGGCAHVTARVFPYLDGECPWDFPIKGNDSRYGFIYHNYESDYYDRVNAEWCFTTEEEAAAYGYRAYKSWKRYRW